MKITRITVFRRDLPLKDPYRLSGGRLKFEVLDATFVKLETDAGLSGWGEGTPWGHTYVPAHAPGAGPRCTDGRIAVGDAPDLGVAPDEGLLGEPVAVYGGAP